MPHELRTGELPLYREANAKPEQSVEGPHRGSLNLDHVEVGEASAGALPARGAAKNDKSKALCCTSNADVEYRHNKTWAVPGTREWVLRASRGFCSSAIAIHTYNNHLPAMVSDLAQYGNQCTVQTRMLALGGWRLRDHWEKGTTRQLLDAKKWDFVVLQECTLVIRKYLRAKSK